MNDFSNKYQNIICNYNKENTIIIDGNFPIVASIATGSFIKFLNDYASFFPGELNNLLDFIEYHKNEKPVMFFPNNSIINEEREIIYCDNLDDFVKVASYWTTWVLAAGFWKEDYDKISDRDRSISKFMWCPDNYFRLVSKKKSIIYNKKIFNMATPKKKGGYNLFNTFGVDYLSMYDEYLINNNIKNVTIRDEKYKLFRYFLFGWYDTLVLKNKKQFKFGKQNAFKILLRNYSFNPYFYLGIIYLHFKHYFSLFTNRS